MSGHTVAAFDVELSRLRETIARMGALAEELLGNALEAIVERDEALAGKVIERDADIDRMEREVEHLAIRLLALRQPMAKDLREVVAAFKISGNIERIGDFAANVAKRTLTLSALPEPGPVKSLLPVGRAAQSMVRDVVAAYAREDVVLAREVRERDDEVDHAYTSLFRELLTYMMESPLRITGCTHLLFIAKALERVGDHATNIAENVCFLVEGRLPEEERPKDDRSSFTVA